MKRGFFLTFEGLDGSGKSTQLRRLAAHLRNSGRPVREMRQPGGTGFGDKVRALLLAEKGQTAIAPRAELAMMFADRAQAIAEVIEPALEAGELLLCDRWTDSTEAYQGGGRALGAEVVHRLHAEVCGGLQPNLTVLLLPPLEVSLQRARRRNERVQAQTGRDESRFEAESEAFFRRSYAQYEAIAAREAVRVVVMKEDEPVELIHARIVRVVEDRLAGWTRPELQ
ncbi:dTMP kinase [Acidipila sp. EB88]|uniref:dTMP kinase n=1 Tax=Acidipila sp. EB88 TaxID=2305226 RepID=UPI000F5E877C|nr:dTMP kinase [Acidipila sp. EB88]RRA49171.1 dTMP kinase [Acidipila sp. EB88]